MWVRSWPWDGFWFLSGLPLGLALYLASVYMHLEPLLITIWFVVIFESAHNLSSMLLAWLHPGLRRIALQRWRRFVALPVVLLIGGTAIGMISDRWWPDYRFAPFTVTGGSVLPGPHDFLFNGPFPWLIGVYFVWNAYHFGKQNFGVMRIYGVTSPRRADLVFCLSIQALLTLVIYAGALPKELRPLLSGAYLVAGLVALGYVARDITLGASWPRAAFAGVQALSLILWAGLWPDWETVSYINPNIGAPGWHVVYKQEIVASHSLWIYAINALNHWLVAIGLSAHVYANRKSWQPWIVAGVLVPVGIVTFAAMFWSPALGPSWNPREVIVVRLPIFGFRIALGFVHFLYDRWVWKLGDLQIREAIGQDLRASNWSMGKNLRVA